MVSDALNRKPMMKLRDMLTHLSVTDDGGLLAELQVKSTLSQQIKEKQLLDEDLVKKIQQVEQNVKGDFDVNADEWKWEMITIDFVSVLLLTPAKKDSVWVIVDWFSKSLHFLVYRTPLCWMELDKKQIVRPDLVRKIEEKVKLICERLKAALGRQKSYADLKCRDIKFQVSSKVFLKVSPWNKKHRLDPLHIVPIEEIGVQPNLTYEEESIEILAREEKALRNKSVLLVKVLWRNHKRDEAIWEVEDAMEQKYPYLFSLGKFRG
ncbi:DNA/RNA polymerases superfamily protein [Gossypium australe]|uniref:DNA/RNA polymerases superfamily protein n=1 Tax=Gossypium australe TaxID=47621 RepID=A0A5B6V1K4_9ROSI|nr:DNA/RNA polymerases superfamily protein [Gossypium australe]